VKSPPRAKITPLEPASEPFYKNQNVLLGGGAALLLVGLLALMRFMRKPKPAFASGRAADDMMAGSDDEELRLRDALQQNPGNTAASLELLRYYYSRGDAARFEATAETMHAHLADPSAPEWDEALAMGAVLAPNHPLFNAVAGEPGMADSAMQEEAVEHHEHAPDRGYPEHAHEPEHMREFNDARTHIGTFDFDTAPPPEPEPAAAATHDDSFDFDLPMHTEETPPPAASVQEVEPEPVLPHEAAAESPVAERSDDIYVGEDAIGTKLDLAKAYLDMGDPEGAKSMLDEVLAEGNDSQRDEARRLIAEIK
jgi:pilus assembly protein FimV